MDHELLDELKQFKTVLWGVQLGMRFQEDNDMGMRKVTLLKLNGIEEGIGFTQHLCDILYKGHKLGSEDTHCQVSTIRGRLAIKE
jgi:hypothetical protein